MKARTARGLSFQPGGLGASSVAARAANSSANRTSAGSRSMSFMKTPMTKWNADDADSADEDGSDKHDKPLLRQNSLSYLCLPFDPSGSALSASSAFHSVRRQYPDFFSHSGSKPVPSAAICLMSL